VPIRLDRLCQVFAGDAGEVRRVLRGGSWNNNERNVRAANRNNNEPSNSNNNIGFRCARSISIGNRRA
jgi:formylglycine-generating enzyme required for sulfatase activity